MTVIGVDPEESVIALPEVNSQLDKVKLPDTVLFNRASREY